MAVNKVIYDGEPLVDLTADTVTAETLMAGVKAHNAAGNPITGLAREITVDSALSETSPNPVQNKVLTSELHSLQNAKLGRAVWRAVNDSNGAIADGQSVSLTLPANACYLVFIWSHAAGAVFSAHLVTTYNGTNNKAASIIGRDYSTVRSSEQTVTMTGTTFNWNYVVVQL